MPYDHGGIRGAVRSAAAWLLSIEAAAVVTTVTSIVFSNAGLTSLGFVFISSGVMVMGVYGLVREHHPPERDERLREFRREKIGRWRDFVDRSQRFYPYADDDESVRYHEMQEYTEIKGHMTESEREECEGKSGRFELEIMRTVLMRLQQEWDLV